MAGEKGRGEGRPSNAALGDLREFIKHAQESGDLVVVKGADPHLEMGVIYELSQKKKYPPVLLFEDMVGCDPRFRVLSNVRNQRFMVGDLDLEALKAFRRRPKGKKEPIPPRELNTGPVFDNVDEGDAVDILKFPNPHWHQGDGGAYIGTECLVITKDPDSDWVNVGTYRVKVHDKKTLTVFIEPGKQGDVIRRKYWARGQACPMAISVGQAPVLGSVASTAYRPGESEFSEAGGRLGRAIDVVRAKLTRLPIPADAELVFEGHMPPPEVETQPEGPFGEWPGYYSADGPQPVLRVEATYYRNDAIVLGQPPTKPNYPGRQVKMSSLASMWDALENAGVPEIRGVWNLPGGGYRFIYVISIKQLHPGHAKMAGLVAAGCGSSYMNRMIIIVDDDVDITDPAEVMWAVATLCYPKTQTVIIDGCWTGYIDPRLPPEKRDSGDVTTSRIIIYAVRPFHWKDEFPKANEVDRAFAESVARKWKGKLPFL
jgi:UbiD family decarboxylase